MFEVGLGCSIGSTDVDGVCALDMDALDVDELAALDLEALDDQELAAVAIAVQRSRNRWDAQCTRLTGALERRGVTQGAVNTPAWLAWRCRMKKSAARVQAANARALRQMPEAADAFAAGDLTSDHVRVLAAARRANPRAFADAEGELVGDARTLRFDPFVRRVQYWRMGADPDGAERDALDAFERRNAFCSSTFEGTRQLNALLDPVGGAVFENELKRLEQRMFEADWSAARERLGDAATPSDLGRTPAQRRADALVEMATRSASFVDSGRPARPLVTVLVGYETFAGPICQLADGTVVTPGQVVPYLTDADVERVVFGGPSRVLDVGVRQRGFTGATRRAVEVRDLECTHESCDVPYDRCEVDHIQPFEARGPTVQRNGRCLCRFHHRRRSP